MSRLAQRLALIVVAIVVSTTLAASPQRASPAESVRGLWVPRSALVSAESIAAMVRAAESGGFNTLLVQVRGRGEAFYRSAIEPRATELDRQPEDFDPLATTLEVARKAGLSVHAWINVNLVASGTTLPRSRDHVVALHPEWLMTPKVLAGTLRKTSARSPAYLGTLARWTRTASDQVEGLYLSPVSAAARAYTVAVVAELAGRYALDGIHLDYIRYPSAEFDYSAATLAEFRDATAASVARTERDRLDRAAVTDPTVWAGARPADWAAFHRDRLTRLVRDAAGAARTARPGLTVSAAVVPVAAEARDQRFQDWVAWARAGHLDAVCPMLYAAPTSEQFGALAGEIAAALGTTPFWAGIGAYRLPLDSTIERVRLARRAGAAGVLLFSYGQLAEVGTAAPAVLTALRPVLLELTNGSGRPR